MILIDQVNRKMDEFTIAIKVLADTAEQLVSVYAKQQAKLEDLAKGMKKGRERCQIR